MIQSASPKEKNPQGFFSFFIDRINVIIAYKQISLPTEEDLISTGILFYADGLQNLYRSNLNLDEVCIGNLTPIEILYNRFKARGIISGYVLALPDEEFFTSLARRAEALGISVQRFPMHKVMEKPAHLRQQRWGLEDDSGDETWLGAVFAAAIADKQWDSLILMPLSNLLIEPAAVFESLELHRREAFDLCFAEERVVGSGWTIFQADLLRGLVKSHDDLMWARGGLSWAVRKPLYPFKTGRYHCPRIRPRLQADLRLNSRRSEYMYSQVAAAGFDSEKFCYANWLADSGWEKPYAEFAPLVINVEPTNNCNATCFNCPHPKMQRPHTYLEKSLLAQVVGQFAAHHEVRWLFSGMGEPLLHPEISELVNLTQGFAAALESSLQVLPPADFPFAELTHLRISLDALEAESFALLRPGCSWQNVETFLNMSREQKKNFPEKFPELGVSFLRHGLNENKQQAFLNYWKQVVKPVFRENFFRWPFQQAPEAIQWCQILGEAEYASAHKRTTKVDFTPFKRRPCRHALLSATILADGSVTACPFDYEGRLSFGNLRQSSFTDLWQSPEYQDFRRQHLQLSFNDDLPCKNCRDWYHPV